MIDISKSEEIRQMNFLPGRRKGVNRAVEKPAIIADGRVNAGRAKKRGGEALEEKREEILKKFVKAVWPKSVRKARKTGEIGRKLDGVRKGQ